ncbi:MAG: RNA methyltransferase, partial [Syntrophobacteraceae bacterium]|nr:RNA methyltransferase [Syntrophobacteraceae bacterium]
MRVNLENITILLHRPSYPENVGAAARAAKNMGLKHLVVVSPQNCDLGRILKMATHWAEDVVVNMEVRDNLREALAPYHFVVG